MCVMFVSLQQPKALVDQQIRGLEVGGDLLRAQSQEGAGLGLL